MRLNGLPDWVDNKLFIIFMREYVPSFSLISFYSGCRSINISIVNNIYINGYDTQGSCIKTKVITQIGNIYDDYKSWLRNYKIDLLNDK